MATSTVNDTRCAACSKAAGTFTCRGCTKDFCLRHTNEHRQELTKQMDEDVIPLYDQLQQNLDEQIKKLDYHPLMKQIDEWEKTSIAKIHQAANDARKQLSNIINKHTIEMKETLEPLKQQLKTAREDDHFFEKDLNEWMKKLAALKKDLVRPQTINIQYDNNTNSFISKILINQTADKSDECFEQSLEDIQITNKGTVITHNQSFIHVSVRGRCEYSSGEHCLRFLIENLSVNKWIFFGIVSKNAPVSISDVASTMSYGFSGGNIIWCCGSPKKNYNGYESDFEVNDTIELCINCDQRKIYLINERIRSRYILDIDIDKCSFPWKLSVGLYSSPGDRIRILQ